MGIFDKIISYWNKKKEHKIYYQFSKEGESNEYVSVLREYVESLGMIDYNKFKTNGCSFNVATQVLTINIIENDKIIPPQNKAIDSVSDIKPQRAN